MWTSKIYVPELLYMVWPWLCLIMACGLCFVGAPFAALSMTVYAGWVLWKRFAHDG